MMFRLIFLGIFVFVSVAGLAFAQDDNVEINLETLEDYTPPPMMFPTLVAEPPAVAAEPAVAVEAPVRRVLPPLPKRKPAYSGPPIAQPETQLDEDALALKTAQDILRAIEGDVPVEVTEAVEPAAPSPEPEPEPAPAPKLKNLSAMDSAAHFEVALPFTTQDEILSKSQKRIVLQQVLIRLQKYEDARLEVRSYAASPDGQESPARRLALARALAVEALLLEKGVGPQRIFLRSLAQKPGTPENSVLLRVTRH